MTRSYNLSALMSAYNYAKHYGRRSGQFDTKRVDRALGYLMDGQAEEKWQEYGTTGSGRSWSCDCPDRHPWCKHIISKMIEVKHDQLMAEFLEPSH